MKARICSLFVLACFCVFSTLPAIAADNVAIMNVSGSQVWFDPLVPNAGFVLSVVHPAGEVQEIQFAAGETPFYAVPSDLPGVYQYELRVIPIGVGTVKRDSGTTPAVVAPVQTGSFHVIDGTVFSEASATAVESPTALVQEMSETFAQLNIQGPDIGIRFEDTSTALGWPSNDWDILINDYVQFGTNHFSIKDLTGNTIPLRVNAGAPDGSLVIGTNGDVGLGTFTPAWDLHIMSSDTPGIRLQQAGGALPPSTFDIRSHEGGIWFQDVSGSGGAPFIVSHGAPHDSVKISSDGYLGLGLPFPVRQLHLRGPNATFRMDRSANTSAFILCRVDGAGNVWKSYIVGTDGFGVNNGQFVIADSGTGAGGASVNRMVIQNDGTVVFGGNVFANNVNQASSIAFKTNVRTIDSAMDLVNRLRGVRFDWKSTGQPSVGLIAEEVEKVIPEVVSQDENDSMKGVNYSALVAVLVEAVKEQQNLVREERKINEEQRSELLSLKAKVEKLEARLQKK